MNGKETRKLVQHTETLTVSIPIWWARYYNLKSGDTMELIIENDTIHMKPQKPCGEEKQHDSEEKGKGG